MKVLQWNILYTEKVENIANFIRTIDPDVLCLQELGYDLEYNSTHTASYLKEKLGMYMFYGLCGKWKNDVEIGNAILSKYPLTNEKKIMLQEHEFDTTDFEKEGRNYLEADITIKDQTYTIATTHLCYSTTFEDTLTKKIETDKLIKLIAEKKSNYIVSGDCNALPSSYTITQMQKYVHHAGPDFALPTWTTKPFDYKGFVTNKLAYRLDYVFCSPDVNVKSATILQTDFSDHLPILLEI